MGGRAAVAGEHGARRRHWRAEAGATLACGSGSPPSSARGAAEARAGSGGGKSGATCGTGGRRGRERQRQWGARAAWDGGGGREGARK